MNDILLATIPAALVLAGMLGVQHIQSRREAKRQELEREQEIREARRKYRENIIAPVRTALNEIQANLAFREYVDVLFKAKEQGILKQESLRDVEMLEELQRGIEISNMRKTLTELLPLAVAITNEEARKTIQQALVSSILTKQTKELLDMKEEDIEQIVKVAYQRLEDFVTLAD
ncbi:MAG: hypothetical protein IMY77_00030 [Chloroflexi bacterium]|nr:hypothetical protein [Chloroflexota bacterium]